jgi:hypothetical protein
VSVALFFFRPAIEKEIGVRSGFQRWSGKSSEFAGHRWRTASEGHPYKLELPAGALTRQTGLLRG